MAKFKLRGEGGLLSRIGRRNLIILAAVLLIGGAITLNYLVFGGSDGIDYGGSNMGDADTDAGTNAGTENNADTYFASAALSRTQARDEAIEVLQTVLANEAALEETREQALADISRIALEIEKEASIETLVRAKGFSECVAVLNGDSASIVVKSDGELLQTQVAQINEIVYEQAGILPVNIKVLAK